MQVTHLAGISGLLTGLVIVGVLAMALQRPNQTVAAFGGGVDTITGTVHGLEGKG